MTSHATLKNKEEKKDQKHRPQTSEPSSQKAIYMTFSTVVNACLGKERGERMMLNKDWTGRYLIAFGQSYTPQAGVSICALIAQTTDPLSPSLSP